MFNKNIDNISKNASASIGRARDIYMKALKNKEMKSDDIEKLSRKYKVMENIARLKSETQERKWKKRRNEYLDNLKKIEMAREEEEKNEKEKTERIMNSIIFKEQHADFSRMEILEKNAKRRFELNNKKINQRKNNSEQKRILKERQEAEKIRLNELKSYKEGIKSIKERISEKLRKSMTTEDYENPYIIAEIRATHNIIQQQKKMESTNLETNVNQTNGILNINNSLVILS